MARLRRTSSSLSALEEQNALAVQVARLYYHQGLTSDEVARELNLSRPKVSRLLTFAKQTGLVEIRIHDPQALPQSLEAKLKERYPFLTPHVVSVPLGSSEDIWLDRVAIATANLLNAHLRPSQTVGLAWGTTLDAVSRALTPKNIADLTFVQLNGSANSLNLVSGFVADTMARFAHNYGAQAHLFPVPTFFDDPRTKKAMWRERTVRHILEIQEQADVLIYSIGSVTAKIPSHVYVSAYLDEPNLRELAQAGAIGDIATVFYRADGSFADIPFNKRASGPSLSIMRTAKWALCVVSGLGKVSALRGALEGRLMNTLVVDEITAHALLYAED